MFTGALPALASRMRGVRVLVPTEKVATVGEIIW